MRRAWAAARRLFAVVFTAIVLGAAVVVLESQAHIDSTFVHVVSVAFASLVALVLVHGLGILEGLGF
jgi:uncharacterized membrane protein